MDNVRDKGIKLGGGGYVSSVREKAIRMKNGNRIRGRKIE